MVNKTDKVILTNLEALKSKYGNAGVVKICGAVDSLIASDKQRGLVTSLIALDNAAAMKKLAFARVTDAGDPKQNKDAIDGIYKALAPDYMLILGAIDVIPHQDLQNPMYDRSCCKIAISLRTPESTGHLADRRQYRSYPETA
jgi:hypothetical protein